MQARNVNRGICKYVQQQNHHQPFGWWSLLLAWHYLTLVAEVAGNSASATAPSQRPKVCNAVPCNITMFCCCCQCDVLALGFCLGVPRWDLLVMSRAQSIWLPPGCLRGMAMSDGCGTKFPLDLTYLSKCVTH